MFNKPTYEELEQRNQLTPTSWRMYALICIMGLIMTGILGYGFLIGDRINRVYAPLVDAVMQIKLEVTTAHLWLEEILSGDHDTDISVVWKHQNQAEWYAKAMLEGGKNPEGTFIPLDDAELLSKIKIVQGKLVAFRKISQQRIVTESISGIGTDIDQQFDDLFHSFLKEADEVETRLQQVMMKDLRSFRFTHVFLITACILLFLIFGIVFWRFDRQRAMNLLLNEANKALEKEIAEHKRAKEALQESEARVQLVLQNMPVMLDAFDEKGHIIVWNLECERVTGNSADEIIGNPNATQLLYPDEDYRTYLKEQLTRCGGKFRNLEWDISCKDGSKKTILWSDISEQFPIPGWHSWTIGLDITRRRQAEESLRKSEERLIEAQQVAKLGHYVLDIKSGYWTNSAGLDDIFGTDENYKKDADGWLQIIYPDSRETMLNYFQNNILGQRQKFDKEYKIINIKTGQNKWVHGLGALKYDEYNNPFELFGTIQDITERKQAEEEREKLISDLQTASAKIKTLSEIIPICAWCKKIRDDEEYWKQVEEYIRDHTEAEFSHGLCPECAAKMEKEIGERE